MPLEVSPGGSDASITVSSTASDKPGQCPESGANAETVDDDHVASR